MCVMVDRITETNSTVSYSRCNHDTDRERGKGRERRRIKDVQYTCRSETQTVTLQLHQSHGLFFFLSRTPQMLEVLAGQRDDDDFGT